MSHSFKVTVVLLIFYLASIAGIDISAILLHNDYNITNENITYVYFQKTLFTLDDTPPIKTSNFMVTNCYYNQSLSSCNNIYSVYKTYNISTSGYCNNGELVKCNLDYDKFALVYYILVNYL